MNYTNLHYGLEKIAITESQALGLNLNKATAIGSVLGALTGGGIAALDSHKDHTLRDSIIGATIGATGGGLIGRNVPMIRINNKIKKLTRIKGKNGNPDKPGMGYSKARIARLEWQKNNYEPAPEEARKIYNSTRLYERFMRSKKVKGFENIE